MFTFGVGNPMGDRYVVINGTHEEARQEMIRRFGLAWGFQYENEEAAGVLKYGLREFVGFGEGGAT